MDIKVPEIGESIVEATISRWHKKEGEAVRKDELLCELETDKITLELHADGDGTLSIEVKEGETVEIGAVIGRIAEGAVPEKTAEKAGEEKPKKGEDRREEIPEPPKALRSPELQAREEKERRAPAPEAPAPAQRAPERPVQAPPPAGPEAEGRVTRRPMSAIRKRIAERLVSVRRQTAMLTTFQEADLGRVQEMRRRHQEGFRKKHGVGLGLMSFFVKATVEALKAYPDVNARIEGDDIVYQNFYDIGIAVGSERGLVVPVLRDADRLQFAEIEQTIREFAEKIEKNRLNLSDLEGGTFTISNGGIYGSLLSTPILNPPQSGVLGMHAIQERPVVHEGEIVVRPMMYLALSYDHRIIDGRQAVGFLKRIKELIEAPEEMLLEL